MCAGSIPYPIPGARSFPAPSFLRPWGSAKSASERSVGESLWTLRRISDGSIYSEETTSAALMQFYFGTLDIEAGESLTTPLIQRTADAPFEWEFSLNYRKPDGARETVHVTAVCA